MEDICKLLGPVVQKYQVEEGKVRLLALHLGPQKNSAVWTISRLTFLSLYEGLALHSRHSVVNSCQFSFPSIHTFLLPDCLSDLAGR